MDPACVPIFKKIWEGEDFFLLIWYGMTHMLIGKGLVLATREAGMQLAALKCILSRSAIHHHQLIYGTEWFLVLYGCLLCCVVPCQISCFVAFVWGLHVVYQLKWYSLFTATIANKIDLYEYLYLKINFIVCRKYAQSFTLSSQSSQYLAMLLY